MWRKSILVVSVVLVAVAGSAAQTQSCAVPDNMTKEQRRGNTSADRWVSHP
jgi:hypothetical protein